MEDFERCFERNYGDIARFCARRAATAEDAEDAATEVFAIAWRRRDALPAAPEDRLWLFGIARRVLANAERAERRRARLTERLKRQPALQHVEPAGLAQALAALAASDRELLLLTGWEGLTPAEIGRVLQRPAALVSRRLYRARKRLAAELAGSGTPTPVEPK
jgi:RNA polymerase sigma factor (sigma-70 family)